MDGEGRALRAAEAAISNPLLDDVSMKGARAVLVNVTGGPDLMLFEVDEAVNRIRAEVDPDANILFGSALSEDMEGRVRVSVVATGIDAESCVRMGDNVQKLHVRRKAVDIETPPAPAASSLARAVFEPIADGAVREQMASLAQELATRVEAPLPEDVPGMAPVAEPLDLSAELEMAEARPAPVAAPALREFPREPMPQEREKRGMFSGLFGGRRRVERAERPIEPVLERPRAPAVTQAVAQPIGRPASASAPQAAAPPPAAQQPAREPQAQPQTRSIQTSADPAQKSQAPADDLFAGVADDDRFEIPAFLRRQAKTGS
jgi:cell division protein FtsZ